MYSSVHCTQCNAFIHNELGQSTVYQSVHNVQFTSYCEGQTFMLFQIFFKPNKQNKQNIDAFFQNLVFKI